MDRRSVGLDWIGVGVSSIPGPNLSGSVFLPLDFAAPVLDFWVCSLIAVSCGVELFYRIDDLVGRSSLSVK
jgi:hypothetical protein